jgi:hypothetical protein
MTVHPWWYAGEGQQAWDEPWYDFFMLQGAHEIGLNPNVSFYTNIYNRATTKPLLEAECRYEGIRSYTDDDVRHVAYRAIQSGSFGYGYGAHGLWYPTQNESDTTFSEWGTPMVWWEALERPGGAQMEHLRNLYESVTWWNLEPRATVIATTADPLGEQQKILVKAAADDTQFVIYFPAGVAATLEARLTGLTPGYDYVARWFDPRTGVSGGLPDLWTVTSTGLTLPDRSDSQDWVLVLEGPRVAPDADRDGDVDLEDFGLFQVCLSGPGTTAGVGCEGFDFDDDSDVDMSDFGLVQRCFSGPAQSADPHCDDVVVSQEAPVLVNGDFANDLSGWSKWVERGAFTPINDSGELHFSADNFNGGMYQQINTGGSGTTIAINGTWSTDPTVANDMWAEVLVINSSRLPANGQDENGQSDLVVIYKNDTWTSTAGWSGTMDQTAAVTNVGQFTAADDVATIILKAGNLGGNVSGIRFDDLTVEVLP